jgi:two-component system sensor histidine kinase MtrB
VRIVLGSDEGSVAVLVRDHGLGLQPGEAGLVFIRVWRAESSRARRSGGTGLGLSISLEDARLHSGWLQAWGEPGRGAAFRLTLPRQLGAELEGSPLPLVPSDEPPAQPLGQPPAQPLGQPAAQPAAQPLGQQGVAPVDGPARTGELW